MYLLRPILPHLARRLSQAAAASSSRSATPSSSTPALSDAALSQHRTKLPHRQSNAWRTSGPSAGVGGTYTPSHEPRSSATSSAPPESRGHRLLLSYHDLERALERRGLNTVRVLLLSAAAAAAGVGLAWPSIKQWGAVEGAEVAAASLETEQLQQRAAAMLHEVIADERTARQVERLLKDAVVGLFRDEEFTESAVGWSAGVLAEALTFEEVRRQGTLYLQSVFDDQESKKSAEDYLTEAIQNVVSDEAVQDTVAKSLWSGVRASLIGRRKPREAPAPAPVEESAPSAGEVESTPKKEAVYASSTLDDAVRNDARSAPNAAVQKKSESISRASGMSVAKGDAG